MTDDGDLGSWLGDLGSLCCILLSCGIWLVLAWLLIG